LFFKTSIFVDILMYDYYTEKRFHRFSPMCLEQWNNPPYKPKSNGDTLPEKTICLGTVNSQ